MNKRLQQFLSAENISQAQFAESIGVARASVSHILAGRNKPGFDFLESMASHYPNLNLEWLITGRGRMYYPTKTATEAPAAGISPLPSREENSLFDEAEIPAETVAPQSPVPPKTYTNHLDNSMQSINNQKEIAKIIVFFTDGSYQELK